MPQTETHGTVEAQQTDTKTEKKATETRVQRDKKMSVTKSSTVMGSHVVAKTSDDIVTQTEEEERAKVQRERTQLGHTLQQVSITLH